MLANGSFEETPVAPNTWAHFGAEQIPGWMSLNNERIELWGKDFMGIIAPQGNNILEIDYHHNEKIDYIYQDVKTNKGQMYEASFFLRARGEEFKSASETAIFSWNGKESSFTAEKAGVWTKITIIVEGTGGLDRLAVRESNASGANNSLGPLLDDFRLVTADCTGSTRSGDKPVPVRCN
jgi:large repetitive protein